MARKIIILHLEASLGWGGQEMRILKEAIGLRRRGHRLIFGVEKKSHLLCALEKENFSCKTFSFKKLSIFLTFFRLLYFVYKERVDVICTHSSMDSWIGGFVGKILRKRIVRTRHLSTSIKGGINAFLLYRFLPDFVVTTCQQTVPYIKKKAYLLDKIQSIPTGIDQSLVKADEKNSQEIRKKFGIQKEDFLVGTACIFRGWKGIEELLLAADLLRQEKGIKFLLIGDGVSREFFLEIHRKLKLEESVFFTGFLSPVYDAISSLDLFVLLSRAHEGVSQASLQAAYLKKPLVHTPTGGLKEVCIHEETGLVVPIKDPKEVAKAIARLYHDPQTRKTYGENAHLLVNKKFLIENMLDELEKIYANNLRVSKIDRSS